MEKHRDNRRYVKWSLDATSELFTRRLSALFSNGKGAHLWVMRASRWVLQTFACYDNFVQTSETGLPNFSGVHGFGRATAWCHLDSLLNNAVSAINEECPEVHATADLPCCIIGFSKGSCVTTQLLYELGVFADLPVFLSIPLVSRTLSLVWLDAGHNGQSHLWPSSPHNLSRLSFLQKLPKIFAFATPYELCDKNRPWNRRDFVAFLRLLKLNKLPHHVDTMFKGEHWDFEAFDCDQEEIGATLDTHFEILSTFPIDLCVSPPVLTHHLGN
ncbi:unnamed protein product [Schistocephalus solidus]|nr:unnamed protein product [Schistocephalus solidus]